MNDMQQRVAVLEKRLFSTLAQRLPLQRLVEARVFEALGDPNAAGILTGPDSQPEVPLTQQPRHIQRALARHIRTNQLKEFNRGNQT